MAWPNRVYFIDAALGIYYAPYFTASGAQPVWATLNTGLSTTDILSFALDKNAAPADYRMFCIEDTTHTLWRRTGGNWAAVLTTAQARVLAGNPVPSTGGYDLLRVAVDATTGYVYTYLKAAYFGDDGYILRSVDHGDTWTAIKSAVDGGASVSNLDAYDGIIVCSLEFPIIGRMMLSVDHGASWTIHTFQHTGYTGQQAVRIHRSGNGIVWGNSDKTGWNVIRFDTATGTFTEPTHYEISSAGGIWTDPHAAGHVVIQPASSFVETVDEFANIAVDEAQSTTLRYEIANDCEDGFWVFAGEGSHGAASPLYVATDGFTLTDRAGANWDTAPFTDSIPETADPIQWGVWVVYDAPTEGPTPPPGSTITPPGGAPITLGGTANVQAVTMPDYTGSGRGIPMPGDRGAWDETLYPTLHARDLKDGTFIHHMDPANPLPRRYDELDDVDTTGVVDGDAMLYDDATDTWLPADVLTPAEHTAIGDGAPHHAAVTLGNFASRILTLTTQTLTTPVVNANKVYAGPTTGADAAPDWRALVAADMPALADHDHTGDAGDGGLIAQLQGAAGNPDGSSASVTGGTGVHDGGNVFVIGGTAGTGRGGEATLAGGDSDVQGGRAQVVGGTGWGVSGIGGDVTLIPGTGTINNGALQLQDPVSGIRAVLDMSDLAVANKTFTFPNASGTFALAGGLGASYYEPVIVGAAGDPHFVWDLSDDIVMAEVAL